MQLYHTASTFKTPAMKAELKGKYCQRFSAFAKHGEENFSQSMLHCWNTVITLSLYCNCKPWDAEYTFATHSGKFQSTKSINHTTLLTCKVWDTEYTFAKRRGKF